MPEWIRQLHYLLTQSVAVSVVTVIVTRGSAPRKTGARMLVTKDCQRGTVGGGNLEFTAIGIARGRLLAKTYSPYRQRFALGPSLGQCCGGSVELLFETIEKGDLIASGDWYCRRIDEPDSEAVQMILASDYPESLKQALDQAPASSCFTLVELAGVIWACDRLTNIDPVVCLFGAGHVGEAVVAQLSLLACNIIWIDERQGIFPAGHSARVSCVATDSPADEVSSVVDDAWFIVMTHSHTADFDICKAILEKQHFSFLGLIGSQTKRNNFTKRLTNRGFDPTLIDRLCCPVGIRMIRSNNPEVIALAVAAQLTILWESKNQLQAESTID